MEQSKAVLDAHVLRGQHEWEIKAFSLQDATVGKALIGPMFEMVGGKWRLEVFPGGDDDEAKGYLGIFVANLNQSEINNVRWTIELLDNDGAATIRFVSKTDTRDFASVFKTWGSPDLASRDDVLDPAKGYLHNDTLRIRVTLERVVNTKPTLVSGKSSGRANVGDSIAQLLECSNYSDVTLHVGGAEIPAHRNILGKRSDYFKAMFAHKMSESLEGVVRIDDIALPVFRQLLRFIYSGSC